MRPNACFCKLAEDWVGFMKKQLPANISISNTTALALLMWLRCRVFGSAVSAAALSMLMVNLLVEVGFV